MIRNEKKMATKIVTKFENACLLVCAAAMSVAVGRPVERPPTLLGSSRPLYSRRLTRSLVVDTAPVVARACFHGELQPLEVVSNLASVDLSE